MLVCFFAATIVLFVAVSFASQRSAFAESGAPSPNSFYSNTNTLDSPRQPRAQRARRSARVSKRSYQKTSARRFGRTFCLSFYSSLLSFKLLPKNTPAPKVDLALGADLGAS